MKLITLNTWGGRRQKELGEFVEKYRDVDIFCFQEVYHEAEGKDTLWSDIAFNLLAYLRERMPEHNFLYHPHWGGLVGSGYVREKRYRDCG